jgi:S-adenosylmethionine hydrolase
VPCPRKIDGSITGEVIYIDTFGNLITNISSHDIEPLKETGPPGRTIIEVIIKGVVIEGISETYTTGVEKQEAPGPLVAVVGSSNLLELACFRAKASEHLDAGAGERVDVRVKKR